MRIKSSNTVVFKGFDGRAMTTVSTLCTCFHPAKKSKAVYLGTHLPERAANGHIEPVWT